MKTKILLSLVLVLNFCLLHSQVPQGFNYQAIARDPSNGNNPITGATMQVKIGILSDTIANTMVWEELFNPVKTNAFGMFTIVVGTGVKQSGSAASFSVIDWTKTPLFLRTSIMYPDPSPFKVMGTSKLQSVPYSMVAANLEGTVPLLSVKGNTTTMDSALFVVRNNTGQIVFAVYNEGVRIYVDDGVAKAGRKGGFAIGSFDKSKGASQPLFVVDPDSIRAYLDNNPVKAVKGGFAIGGFDRSKSANQNFLMVSKDSIRMYIDDNLTKASTKGGFAIGSFDKSKGGNVNFLNVSTDSSGIINPSQNRILWYPTKNAFLTGRVLIQKPDSVGVNSFASGYESKAKGKYSQALGFQTIARGDYSTAIGKNAIADSTDSFAFGNGTKATKKGSYSLGSGAIASGNQSFAFGSVGIDTFRVVTGINTQALGDNSFAIGMGAISSKVGAFAIGTGANATGSFALSLGYGTTSSGSCSTTLGFVSEASRDFSIAIGNANSTTGSESLSFGFATETSGDLSLGIGVQNRSVGYNSETIGTWNRVDTSFSIAYGNHNTVHGTWSSTFGSYNNISGDGALAIGNSNTASGYGSTTIGQFAKATAFSSISIGNNAYSSGGASTAIGYSVIASGTGSTAMGVCTQAKSLNSFAVGTYNDTTCSVSGSESWIPTDPLFIVGNGNPGDRENAFTVLKNGNTAIGHASPTQMLDVNGNARFRSVGSATFGNNLNITSDGTLTTSTSDVRMKENIVQIPNALEQVSKLRGVSFTWKNDSTKTQQIGMIAQEVEPIVPEIVFTNPVDGLKGINYSQASALFVEAIKEQQQQIESLKNEVNDLKTLVTTLVANQTGQGNK